MDSVELIKQAVATKGKANLSFSGKSMHPTLKDAMVVTISRFLPESVRVSDIIAYQQNNQIVAHRVIKIIKNNAEILFITKGDNQPFGGISEVRRGDFIGRIKSAFYANSGEKNILRENMLYRLLYVWAGRLYLFYRRSIRNHIPDSLRLFLKAFVENIYYCFQGCSNRG